MAVFTAIGAAVFGAGTFMAAATAAGLQLVAGVAFSLIGKAMQGEPEPPRFGVQGRLQAGEDVPRSINLGWNCTAGSLAYHNTFGSGGTMSARVIALGDLPIRSLERVFVDGVESALNKASPHASYGWPVTPFRKDGKDHMWIKFYDGTQSAADPFLVSTFGGDAERPYGSDRIGRGIPYAIVFARAPERKDGEEKPLFQGIPNLKFETFGVRWYNPARDSSVGGSGTQRWNNHATWGGDAGDFNPIVHLYNTLRGVRYNGEWVYGAQAIMPARLPVENWIAGINAAQANIAGPSGNEPTYRAGGEVQVGAQVATTVEALLTAANARLTEVGGTYKIYVGAPGSPVMSFTDGDILSNEEQSFTPFFALSDTVNGVDASWPNPAEGWNTKKAPPLLRPDLEVLDGNRRLMATVSLDLVPYGAQAQRLMQWALAEALRARRHTFVLGPEFRGLEPGDVVQWTSARNGYEDKLFRVDGIVYRSDLDVIVDLTEVDPSDYDWDQEADYTPVVDGPLNLVGPRPMPMTGWQVFPAIIYDDQGRSRRPSIEVWAASGVPGVERVHVQVRVGDENGQLVFDSDSQPYTDPWRWVLQGQFSADTAYVVRGIFVGPPAAEWSGWLAVTTPDIRLGPLDVIYGDIDLDELGEQIEGYFEWLGTNMRSVIEQAEAQAVLTGDQELANATQFDEMRRSVSVAVGDLSASFDEVITVALVEINGEMTAISGQLTTLEANFGTAVASINDDLLTLATETSAISDQVTVLQTEVGDVASSVTVRGTSQTSPGGGWARWGVEVKTGTEGDWSSGAFFIDTNGSLSRAAFVVDQFVIQSGVGDNAFIPFAVSDEVIVIRAKMMGPAMEIDPFTGFFSFG